jgi:hypothetical protein
VLAETGGTVPTIMNIKTFNDGITRQQLLAADVPSEVLFAPMIYVKETSDFPLAQSAAAEIASRDGSMKGIRPPFPIMRMNIEMYRPEGVSPMTYRFWLAIESHERGAFLGMRCFFKALMGGSKGWDSSTKEGYASVGVGGIPGWRASMLGELTGEYLELSNLDAQEFAQNLFLLVAGVSLWCSYPGNFLTEMRPGRAGKERDLDAIPHALRHHQPVPPGQRDVIFKIPPPPYRRRRQEGDYTQGAFQKGALSSAH